MHIRRIQRYVLVSVLLCASPFGAGAQWAATITEHDWQLTIAGRPYGLVQRVQYLGARVGGTRMTTLYLGTYTANTRAPATWVATMILLPAAATGLLVLKGLLPQKRES